MTVNELHIPQKIRHLYLAIWAGRRPVHDVTEKLHYLDSFFPRAKLEEALRYLVKNKLVGDSFVQWWMGDCHGSNLEMHRVLIQKVERERRTRALTQKDLK